MKKYFVLTILFVLPIIIYLFFLTGEHNFFKLPVITEDVHDIKDFSNFQLKDKITIISFLGADLNEDKTSALNINMKIYNRFFMFDDFQFISLLPIGSEEKAMDLKNELTAITGTDLSKWGFVFLKDDQLNKIFNSLNLPIFLDDNLSSPYVYIIDKDLNLRGNRDDDNFIGYNSKSIADINNNMVDDVKVILAEYRMALKKYN
ncbi:MAG: hypothetical protein VXV72_03910 [Bacteroidota bacterium]|nr:hypothetical protein [Bacteroidota bacterium]MEC7548485.1 hypothetical protein [Bacteroidota bacterium]MEC8098269.1 hypothetical protein [Bacteroidota bacterium]